MQFKAEYDKLSLSVPFALTGYNSFVNTNVTAFVIFVINKSEYLISTRELWIHLKSWLCVFFSLHTSFPKPEFPGNSLKIFIVVIPFKFDSRKREIWRAKLDACINVYISACWLWKTQNIA